MPTRQDAVHRFLAARGRPLAPGLELQINVVRRGEKLEHGWTDGEFTYCDLRIDNAERAAKPLGFPLEIYGEFIGSTGRDWSASVSRWVGFDFDAVTCHAPGVGITAAELDRVRQAAQALPYVEVRKSTSGRGLHLYVYLDVPTANRAEHAALARAMLGTMSLDTGFDFQIQVDVCGGNMWLWSSRAASDGLTIIKPAERKADPPPNWRDHIEVVSRRRSKVKLAGVDDADLESLYCDTIPLDGEHRRVMDAVAKLGFTSAWVADHHLWQTHTVALARLVNEGQAKGIFQTLSPGTDPASPNCYCFPLAHGGWKVFRFGNSPEAPTWSDGFCYFNRQPDLATAAKAFSGIKDPDKGGYVFTAGQAIKAAEALGQKIELPESMSDRKARLKTKKGGLAIYVAKEDGDANMPGWLREKEWMREYDVATEAPRETTNDHIRILITPQHQAAGAVIRSAAGTWDTHPVSTVKHVLQSRGMSKTDAEIAIGSAALNRWKLVNVPFQPEYLGDRQWNRDAAQFRHVPSEGQHPTWDAVFEHCGQNLTVDDWCRDNGILSGTDYLCHWAANAIRRPFDPLPYVFFVGPEDSGKSSFWESLALLMTRGVVKADRALTNETGYNAELEGAIIAVVEEVDLGGDSRARNRIRDYVTSRVLSVRRMRTDVYQTVSTLHWCQTANDASYCCIPDGDTRTVVAFVPKPAKPRDKAELFASLEREAPHFLFSLLNLRLAGTGRLRLPVLKTQAKTAVSSPLADYIETRLVIDPKAKVCKADVFGDYVEWGGELDEKKFGAALKKYMEARHFTFSAAGKAYRADGERGNAYAGVRLND